MAHDNGTMTKLEEYVVAILSALTDADGEAIFKTVEHWNGQIASGGSGLASFDKFAPFAFISCYHERPDFEGDRDLKQSFIIAVAIGQSGKDLVEARIGSDRQLGCSMLHDLVIDALNDTHPGEGVQTENLYYDGAQLIINGDKKYAEQIEFKADYITV